MWKLLWHIDTISQIDSFEYNVFCTTNNFLRKDQTRTLGEMKKHLREGVFLQLKLICELM